MKKTITLITLMFGLAVYAQPDNPNPPTPIGGIALLAAAGVALGAKKLYDKK